MSFGAGAGIGRQFLMGNSSGLLRAYALLLAFVLAFLMYAVTVMLPSGPVAPRPAEAATPAVTVTVGCYTNPETTRVRNNRSYAIAVRSVGSIYRPRSNEPFYLNYRLAAGRAITLQTGYSASYNVLTRQYIYENTVGTSEGARVATSAGTFYDRCG